MNSNSFRLKIALLSGLITGLLLVVGYNWLVYLLRVKAKLPLN